MIDIERFRQSKAIISDWDDTKVRTRPKIIEIIDNFADILEVPPPGEDGLLKYWGQSVEEIIYGLFGTHKPHLSSNELMNQYIASVPSDYCPYPLNGLEQAVLKLHAMDYHLGIVSSGPKKGILRDIRTHYPLLEDIYSFIHGREDTPKHKPHPEVFNPAFTETLYPQGITEHQTIYVGDFHSDFDAAQNRGLLFIGIVDNDRARDWFIKRGLDQQLMLPSFTDIPSFLTKIKN